MADKLDRYRAKRDFKSTPEPSGTRCEAAQGRAALRRPGAQRDAASLGPAPGARGALASWALPRFFPNASGDNRLAVRTEDHPLEYLEFHGEIPAGQYGAGTMTVYDTGTYDVLKWEPRKVEVEFHGERLTGRYALFPLARSGEPAGKDWMIHRMGEPLDPGRRAAARVRRADALARRAICRRGRGGSTRSSGTGCARSPARSPAG